MMMMIVSKILMNVAVNGIVAAKKIKYQFHGGNCVTYLFGGKIDAQEQPVVQYGIAHWRSQFRTKYAS